MLSFFIAGIQTLANKCIHRVGRFPDICHVDTTCIVEAVSVKDAAGGLLLLRYSSTYVRWSRARQNGPFVPTGTLSVFLVDFRLREYTNRTARSPASDRPLDRRGSMRVGCGAGVQSHGR